MRYIGVKLTHDASVAIVEDSELVASIELEKLHDNKRHCKANGLNEIDAVLREQGLPPMCDRDVVVIDGWLCDRMPSGYAHVAPYVCDDLLAATNVLAGTVSYSHITGHVIGTYLGSPYAGQRCNVLVWDGGITPRLYAVDSKAEPKVKFVGVAHQFSGLIMSMLGFYFGPYKREDIIAYSRTANPMQKWGYSEGRGTHETPGKLMAYAALGNECDRIRNTCNQIYADLTVAHERDWGWNGQGYYEHEFYRRLSAWTEREQARDADVIATVQSWLGELLLDGINELAISPMEPLLSTGGCALNIKWNSVLRRLYPFMWVPPWCNDSGSALGQAATHSALATGYWGLRWRLYSGPKLQPLGQAPKGCGLPLRLAPYELGRWLAAHPDWRVAALHGQAELGPRALGHRSLLGHPGSIAMQLMLNAVKGREAWRPVAPLCLEAYADVYFDGVGNTGDPYMLYDHIATVKTRMVAPATVHIDGTARLQTINSTQCRDMFDVLRGFFDSTGIPILCNTSANLPGCGFFDSVSSAAAWAAQHERVAVWDGAWLYRR